MGFFLKLFSPGRKILKISWYVLLHAIPPFSILDLCSYIFKILLCFLFYFLLLFCLLFRPHIFSTFIVLYSFVLFKFLNSFRFFLNIVLIMRPFNYFRCILRLSVLKLEYKTRMKDLEAVVSVFWKSSYTFKFYDISWVRLSLGFSIWEFSCIFLVIWIFFLVNLFAQR